MRQISVLLALSVVIILLVSECVDCRRNARRQSVDDVGRRRGDVTPAPTYDESNRRRPTPATTGRPVSSWRRWMEQFRPHRLHGAVQIGPGYDVRFETDFGWNWDIQSKWWLGENVCERTVDTQEEVVNGTSSSHHLLYSRTCNGINNEYRCTTTRIDQGRRTVVTTVYECCPGYTRSSDSHTTGCSEEVILSDTVSTLERLRTAEMIHALSMTGLTDAVQQRNYTVFAPVDEAFASYKPLQDANLNVVRVSPNSLNSVTDILEDIVSGHIIEGRVRTNDFVNDQLFDTALKAGTIRLNKYNIFPQKILTANCVPLINADVLTTNGIVHVVERVLPNARQTLEQLVLSHPDLTTFASVVSRLGLSETGPFTLFAPSNAAFDRLDLNLRDRLLSPDSCELKILRQHILPSVVCSASIIAGFRVGVLNVDDRYITLRHIPDTDVLTVEGANTTDTDIMATNGVLHIIDSVLFEQAASNLLEVAKRVGGASKFLKLVELSGVQSRLNSLDNFTMFLPTDEAIKAIADRLGNMSTTQLEQLVEYHIVPEQRRLNKDLHSDQQLPSMSSGNHLQIKHYHSFPFGAQSRKTVQCATFVTTDINNGSVCSGIGHIINTVLIPPVNSVLDVLMSDRKFSNVMQLIKTSGLTELLQQQDSHVTFFAPTNQAFESLSPDLLNQLRSSPEIARHVLRSHMLADVLCCAGIFPRRFLQMAVREVNLDGWMIAVDRLQNTVHYGNVPVQSCDMMAANGVVHTVNTFVPSAIARYITTQDEDDDSSLETLWDRLWDL